MKRKTCMTSLAMAIGLCFSMSLFANVEVDENQKKKYANSRFVWTEN